MTIAETGAGRVLKRPPKNVSGSFQLLSSQGEISRLLSICIVQMYLKMLCSLVTAPKPCHMAHW